MSYFNKDMYFPFDVTTWDGKKKTITLHSFLYGLLLATHIKKQNKFHSMILVTGAVGAGKTSLAEGIAGIDAHIRKTTISIEKNISWTTEKLIAQTDRNDNYEDVLWWDESIQGAGGRNMALTDIGNKLKKALVTKRTKKHTYIFLIDEIEEYSWKLIKMCTAWIHVEKEYLDRGMFKCFLAKNKIKYLYTQMKVFRHSWGHPDVNCVRPDGVGRFQDFTNIFIDVDEYEKQKIEQTKQIEEEGKKKKEKKEEKEAPRKNSREVMAELKFKELEKHYLGNIGASTAKLAQLTGFNRKWVTDNLAVLKEMYPHVQGGTYNNTTN
jgi:energy-coupling factor transporter ATP-binding protein EcfA2